TGHCFLFDSGEVSDVHQCIDPMQRVPNLIHCHTQFVTLHHQSPGGLDRHPGGSTMVRVNLVNRRCEHEVGIGTQDVLHRPDHRAFVACDSTIGLLPECHAGNTQPRACRTT